MSLQHHLLTGQERINAHEPNSTVPEQAKKGEFRAQRHKLIATTDIHCTRDICEDSVYHLPGKKKHLGNRKFFMGYSIDVGQFVHCSASLLAVFVMFHKWGR